MYHRFKKPRGSHRMILDKFVNDEEVVENVTYDTC